MLQTQDIVQELGTQRSQLRIINKRVTTYSHEFPLPKLHYLNFSAEQLLKLRKKLIVTMTGVSENHLLPSFCSSVSSFFSSPEKTR